MFVCSVCTYEAPSRYALRTVYEQNILCDQNGQPNVLVHCERYNRRSLGLALWGVPLCPPGYKECMSIERQGLYCLLINILKLLG